MRRCEDEKMFYRPPLLEEPCAQTLSGKSQKVYTFRLFDFSSSLSTLNGLSFVLLAACLRLKRHPAKKTKSQNVKTQKVYFATLRFFDFSSTLSPFDFWTFRLFFFPLDSQRFKFCTFSGVCSAEKASGNK